MKVSRLGVPVEAGTYRVTSGFGPRNGAVHRGIDYASATPGRSYADAKILAAGDGDVLEARAADAPGEPGWVGGFGGWVIVSHLIGGESVDTIYGHMHPSGLRVRAGDRVTRGQWIADVGNNGDTTAPHLHFEVWTGGRYRGTAVDPSPWLVP